MNRWVIGLHTQGRLVTDGFGWLDVLYGSREKAFLSHTNTRLIPLDILILAFDKSLHTDFGSAHIWKFLIASFHCTYLTLHRTQLNIKGGYGDRSSHHTNTLSAHMGWLGNG